MQEIIVYRNPVEAAFWHSIMGGDLFPIMVAMFVAVVTIVACCSVVNKFVPRNKQKVWINLSLVAGAVAAIAVLWAM